MERERGMSQREEWEEEKGVKREGKRRTGDEKRLAVERGVGEAEGGK